MNKNGLLSCLLGAITTLPKRSSSFIEEGPFSHADQQTLSVQADRAERSLTVALNSLGEIIEAVLPHLDFSSDISLLPQLVELAAKLEVFVAKLRHFRLEVSNIEGEVGNRALKLSIMDLFRNLAQFFGPRKNIINNTHTKSSCTIEILKLIKDPTAPLIEQQDELYNIALTMLMQECGIYEAAK